MLSKKTKYAINALVYLAQKPAKEPVLISEIASHENIPKKFLETILLDLRNAGILNSKKGKGGGYYLIKHPSEVNLAENSSLFSTAQLDCFLALRINIMRNVKSVKTRLLADPACFMAIRNETVELLKKDTLEVIIKNEQRLKKINGK